MQLCDSVPPGVRMDIKSALPAVRIVQVIHVVGPESVEEAMHVEETADALLLDSGNPSLVVKELGGTGRTHDWTVSAELCRKVRVPVFLAGGLNASNVREAIATVHPFGVDVCSGVRSGGKLDPLKLSAFAAAVLT